jgi:hypothetical protein
MLNIIYLFIYLFIYLCDRKRNDIIKDRWIFPFVYELQIRCISLSLKVYTRKAYENASLGVHYKPLGENPCMSQ